MQTWSRLLSIADPPIKPACSKCQSKAVDVRWLDMLREPCSRNILRGASLHAGQLQQAEQEANRWRSAASQAQAAAAKLEADMEGLGTAYNMLETHSHDLEARLQELDNIGGYPAYMLATLFITNVLLILLRPFFQIHILLSATDTLQVLQLSVFKVKQTCLGAFP